MEYRAGLGAFPPAWIAHDIHEAKDWKQAFYYLSLGDRQNQAWFEPGDTPPDFPQLDNWLGTRKELGWHRGGRRARRPMYLDPAGELYYPGWSYQLDDGSKRPVLKVNCGLQGVPLLGAGTQRITVQYSPTGLLRAAIISARCRCRRIDRPACDRAWNPQGYFCVTLHVVLVGVRKVIESSG